MVKPAMAPPRRTFTDRRAGPAGAPGPAGAALAALALAAFGAGACTDSAPSYDADIRRDGDSPWTADASPAGDGGTPRDRAADLGGSSDATPAPPGAHCPGGTPQNAFTWYRYDAQTCANYPFPGPSGRQAISATLAVAAAANTSYAVSFQFDAAPLDWEIWSVSAQCGAPLEKLAGVQFAGGPGTYCLDLHPTAATNHLIFTTQTTYEMRTIAFCPGVRCRP